MQIVRAAEAAGVKAAAVQDKVYLPGFHKLRKVRDSGFFGRILSARLESGWWVFDGELHPAQRSSWNYRKKDGGGLVLDMYPHWRYLLTSLIGPIKAVSCRKVTQIPQRIDEAGEPYDVDVEDEVFATFEFESGAMAQVTTSWATRVKRDDMIQIQIDGTLGSAVAGGHRCFVQSLAATPKPAWDVERAAGDELRRAVAGSARHRAVQEQLSLGLGAVPAPRRGGRAVALADAGRREGRAAHRAVLPERPRAALGGCAEAYSVARRLKPCKRNPGRVP